VAKREGNLGCSPNRIAGSPVWAPSSLLAAEPGRAWSARGALRPAEEPSTAPLNSRLSREQGQPPPHPARPGPAPPGPGPPRELEESLARAAGSAFDLPLDWRGFRPVPAHRVPLVHLPAPKSGYAIYPSPYAARHCSQFGNPKCGPRRRPAPREPTRLPRVRGALPSRLGAASERSHVGAATFAAAERKSHPATLGGSMITGRPGRWDGAFPRPADWDQRCARPDLDAYGLPAWNPAPARTATKAAPDRRAPPSTTMTPGFPGPPVNNGPASFVRPRGGIPLTSPSPSPTRGSPGLKRALYQIRGLLGRFFLVFARDWWTPVPPRENTRPWPEQPCRGWLAMWPTPRGKRPSPRPILLKYRAGLGTALPPVDLLTAPGVSSSRSWINLERSRRRSQRREFPCCNEQRPPRPPSPAQRPTPHPARARPWSPSTPLYSGPPVASRRAGSAAPGSRPMACP